MGKEISCEMKDTGEIVLYRTEDGRTRIECRFADENISLTQALMAKLFQTTVPDINLHSTNSLDEEEVSPEATIKNYFIVRFEQGRREKKNG